MGIFFLRIAKWKLQTGSSGENKGSSNQVQVLGKLKGKEKEVGIWVQKTRDYDHTYLTLRFLPCALILNLLRNKKRKTLPTT